jgi:hypothetical protein
LYLPQGEIHNAWREDPLRNAPHPKRTPAQKAGLAYQKKIGKFLASPGPSSWRVLEGPWFAFVDDSPRRHYCQPDFLVDCGGGLALVVEVKYRWTPTAWWQLRKLYLPVVARARAGVELIPLCITRSFDPAEGVPSEEPHFCDDLFDAKPDRFNLLVVR